MNKRTVITIETWRKTVRHTQMVRCELCAAEVEMLLPAQAAILANSTERAIFRGLEAGEFHFTETTGGGVLICGDSLAVKHRR